MVNLGMRNMETTQRAIIISKKVDCFETALSKALMITVLKEKMSKGIVHFLYQKIDGSIREAFGTTHRVIVESKTNGNGTSPERRNMTAYFDVEKGQWRCFKWENFIGILNS